MTAHNTRSRRLAGLLTSTQIADLCGVQLSVVSNWKTRYEFPAPVDQVNGADVYSRSEIVEFLREMAARRLAEADKTLASAKQALDRAAANQQKVRAYATRVRRIRA